MKSSQRSAMRVPEELPLHHLVPYLLAVLASFVWFLPWEPTPWRAFLKFLPILYLIAYMGITERGKGESGKVLLALIFSAIGDAFLAYPDAWFVQGIQAFGVAQIFYTAAFGFEGIRLPMGIGLYGIGFVLLCFILPHIPTPLNVAIPIYNLLIGTMFWRALDRYALMSHIRFERRLCSVLGAVLFITSDSCIVFLQIFQLIPHIPAQIIILSTYYSAQLLLMLGSADSFWARKSELVKKETAKKNT
ncbi:lysoplasmalogenase TMEM86B-like [Macrobrachium nipponense]|uniref:lysoplasmalogenase TMEM86B-like n=1 Tax=Macrobrachium nipponense TaxID=159736 RepID=UPI0030C89F28